MSNKTLYKHRISTCNSRRAKIKNIIIKLSVKPVVLHLNSILHKIMYSSKLLSYIYTLNFLKKKKKGYKVQLI